MFVPRFLRTRVSIISIFVFLPIGESKPRGRVLLVASHVDREISLIDLHPYSQFKYRFCDQAACRKKMCPQLRW